MRQIRNWLGVWSRWGSLQRYYRRFSWI